MHLFGHSVHLHESLHFGMFGLYGPIDVIKCDQNSQGLRVLDAHDVVENYTTKAAVDRSFGR